VELADRRRGTHSIEAVELAKGRGAREAEFETGGSQKSGAQGLVFGGRWVGRIEEAIESGAADAEHAGGANFVAVGSGQNADDVAKDRAVEVGIVVSAFLGMSVGGSDRPVEAGNVDGPDPLAGTFEGRGNDDRFELANVSGPRMGEEAAESAGGEAADLAIVAKAPVPQQKAAEQRDVFAAVAERREHEADGGKVVGEIGAKSPGGSEAAERLGRSNDDLQRSG